MHIRICGSLFVVGYAPLAPSSVWPAVPVSTYYIVYACVRSTSSECPWKDRPTDRPSGQSEQAHKLISGEREEGRICFSLSVSFLPTFLLHFPPNHYSFDLIRQPFLSGDPIYSSLLSSRPLPPLPPPWPLLTSSGLQFTSSSSSSSFSLLAHIQRERAEGGRDGGTEA